MLSEGKPDSVLEVILSRWGIPGLGLGIFHTGEIVYTRGLGVQSLGTRAHRPWPGELEGPPVAGPGSGNAGSGLHGNYQGPIHRRRHC